MVIAGRNSTYPNILKAGWRQHRARRKEGAPTVISTFAGCGGSSLGWSMAGYHELLAVEWDQYAADIFRLNFKDVPVYQGDIKDLSVARVLETCDLAPGELDVLDGSPPCQGFSTAGKRILEDPRNELYLEFSRLLHGLQPKAFIMENVPGMVKGKMKLVFREIMKDLKKAGYRVSARKVNMMWFNVPQKRERMIFVGVRNDLEIEPSHPEPEVPPITVRQAFEGLVPLDDWAHIPQSAQRYKNFVMQGETFGRVHPKGHFFDWRKLAWNRPAATLKTKNVFLHPEENRLIGVSEAKRIMSFPDQFLIPKDDSGKIPFYRAMRILGNAVPPMFMRSMARHVRKTMLEPISEL